MLLFYIIHNQGSFYVNKDTFSGFCWISAMVLIIKIKRPKRQMKEVPSEPEIIEKPVIIEKKVIVEVPKIVEKKPEPNLPEGKVEDYFVASKDLDKYHLYNCKWVKIIKPENRVYFKTKDQAKKAGYKICKTCKKKMR